MQIDCTDGQATVSELATVIINEDNQKPDITNLPATIQGHWNKAGSFNPTATDADLPAQALTWSRTGNTCNFTPEVNTNSGAVSWICNGVQSCSLEVTVQDNGNPVMKDAKTISLECTNQDAPVIAGSAPTTAEEGSGYSYLVRCSDADGDAVQIRVGEGDSCGGAIQEVSAGEALYSFTPDETLGNGSCLLKVDCTDHQTTVSEAATISVDEDNKAPRFTNLPHTQVGHWSKSHYFVPTVQDDDLPAQTLTFVRLGNGCSFDATVNESSGRVDWTCTKIETCQVPIKVYDNGDPAASDIQTLTISCANSSAPRITSSAPATVLENTTYSYAVTCEDSDGDPLTLVKGKGDSCEGALQDNGGGQGSYTFSPDEEAGGTNCDVEIVCSDGANTHTETVTVAIGEDNRPPTLRNMPATQNAHWRTLGSFDANAQDPDQPLQTLTYSLAGHSCTFTPQINSSSGLVTWTCGKVENCTANVKVEDNGSPKYSDTRVLTINCTNANWPRITSQAPANALEQQEYIYNIACSDDDGDPVALTKVEGDTCNGVVIDNQNGTGTYRFTPGEDQGGTNCLVKVKCSDGPNGVIESKSVAIGEHNRAPFFTNLPYTEATHWRSAGSYTLTGGDNDTPSQTLSFSRVNDACSFTPTVNGTSG